MLKDGVYFGLASEKYFSDPRINASGLKILAEKPGAYYKASLTEKRAPSRAFMLGSAIHTMVLENDQFYNRYTVMGDDVNGRTKEGKQAKKDAASGGLEVINSSDFHIIKSAYEAVFKNKLAAKLFSSGKPEVTVCSQIDGVPAKARLDWYRSNVIVDLKTTDSIAEFSKSMAKYLYHLQSAWYMDCCRAAGMGIQKFLFVVVEKAYPYGVIVYEIDDEALWEGKVRYLKALQTYKQCTDSGIWPGYGDNLQILSLPRWALSK